VTGIFFSSFSYDDNPGLHKRNKKHFPLILGISIGVLVILPLISTLPSDLGLKKGNWCLKKKNFFYFNFRVHVI